MMKFLLKGLLRDRSRSLFRMLMVAAGVFIAVFMHGWMEGALTDLIDTNARFNEGHVKIMTRAYREQKDQVPNDLALLETGELLKNLNKMRADMFWVPRIKFGGLLDIPDENRETLEQGPVTGQGIDFDKEEEILKIKRAVVKGSLPDDKGEILIAKNLAEKLKVDTGDTATFIGSTMNGAMTVYNFKVSGLVEFGIVAMDKGTVLARISDMREILNMPGGASEAYGFSKDMFYADEDMAALSAKFNKKYSDEKDEFSPVMEPLSAQPGMGYYIDMGEFMAAIIMSVFIFAMAIVLWNAGLMDGIRRYGEIGVRLAMGESKHGIYVRMLTESVAIAVVGSVIGTLLGLAATYYMQEVGLNIEFAVQDSSMAISNIMRAKVTPLTYVVGFIPGVFASVIGTMFAGIGIYRRNTAQLFSELDR
jgi:putative ABC transport system permease protein